MKTTLPDPLQFIGQVITILIDRPLGSQHPQWDFHYPLNYGFVPDFISEDGEGLDAYVLGVDEALAFFTGCCIAVLVRKDDPGDPKLVLAPPDLVFSDEDILELVNFQERYFDTVLHRISA